MVLPVPVASGPVDGSDGVSSEKVKGLYVAFDRDITTEGAEMVAKAVRMLRYVAAVEFEEQIVEHNDWMERERLRSEVADVTTTVLRALLTRDGSYYVPAQTKDKIILELERILHGLREKR